MHLEQYSHSPSPSPSPRRSMSCSSLEEFILEDPPPPQIQEDHRRRRRRRLLSMCCSSIVSALGGHFFFCSCHILGTFIAVQRLTDIMRDDQRQNMSLCPYNGHVHTLWAVHFVVILCRAFLTCSTGCWSDTAATVKLSW